MPDNPVTQCAHSPDFWNDSLEGDYLWSNVNFGEAVTEVMTPLTWSVIQFTLEDWVFLPGRSTVGIIGGRPYLNISIFATLFYGLGRSRQDLLDYMESTLYMRLPDKMGIPGIQLPPFQLLQGMFSALEVSWKQRRGVQRARAYLEANQTWFKGIRTAIQSQKTSRDLYNLWQAEMKSHLKQGAWCVLGSASYSADYTLKLRRQLSERVGPEAANILIANLSQGDSLLDSLGPIAGLEKLARGEMSRTTYLEKYGHRGPQEFELSAPRPAEDSTWLDQELARLRQKPVEIEELVARQRQAYQSAWERLQAQAPTAARRFNRQIAESVRRARLRELARSAYVRDRWAVRLFTLRAGELTGLKEGAFYLTLPEMLALLQGDRACLQNIEDRMAAYHHYRQLPLYPSVIRGAFDPESWAADPHRSTNIYDASLTLNTREESEQVRGSPGSAGIVEGVVRIITHPDAGAPLEEGEILVAVQTDIAWTLLFPRAAGVITDIGAPLSHAAIVARELGIPAVVGCGNATAVLKSGDRVRMDGSRGVVNILDRA